MTNKTVLVTGATGFVGSRLVERLVLGTDYKVKAMIRRFSGAGLARLARLPVELVLADLLDLDALTEAAQNCELIVHCAYGSSGNSQQQKEVTISGIENVMQAALQSNVQKVIYLSSAVVHGRDPKSPIVDETAPFGSDSDVYTVSKIEAEKIVWKYHQEHALPVVVFRPTLVYGPYSTTWTSRIIKEIQSSAVLVNDGQGAANLVYVDNLIDAILMAMEKEAGDGQAFILVDQEQLSWQDVYQRYAGMMSAHPPLQSISAEKIKAIRKAGQPTMFDEWVMAPWQILLEMIRSVFQSRESRRKLGRIPWLKFVSKLLPRQIKDLIKGAPGGGPALAKVAKSSHIQLPDKNMVELYASQARFSNQKVRQVFDYTQRITFDEASELIRSWLQYQRLIP